MLRRVLTRQPANHEHVRIVFWVLVNQQIEIPEVRDDIFDIDFQMEEVFLQDHKVVIHANSVVFDKGLKGSPDIDSELGRPGHTGLQMNVE